MTWPIVDGVSLMHLHISRGKRSIVIDLRNDEDVAIFKELAETADVVVEAMRPGGLARRGRRVRAAAAVQSQDRLLHHLGIRHDRALPELAGHGIAFDTWAGIVHAPGRRGRIRLPARACLHGNPRGSAVRRAGHAGGGAPGPFDTARAACSRSPSPMPRRPWTGTGARRGRPTSDLSRKSRATRPTTTSDVSLAPPGWIEGVRYQVYEAKDGRYVLFMASEQAFWKNFCDGVDRLDLFETLARLEVRRPRPQQPRAARRAARHLPHQDRRGMDRLRSEPTPRSPGQHAQDHRRRPPVPATGSAGSRHRRARAPTCSRRRSSSSARLCPPRPMPRQSASTPTRCCMTSWAGTTLASPSHGPVVGWVARDPPVRSAASDRAGNRVPAELDRPPPAPADPQAGRSPPAHSGPLI